VPDFAARALFEAGLPPTTETRPGVDWQQTCRLLRCRGDRTGTAFCAVLPLLRSTLGAPDGSLEDLLHHAGLRLGVVVHVPVVTGEGALDLLVA